MISAIDADDLRAQTADELRDALVDRIVADYAAIGYSFSDRAVNAMRTVPRHLFTPGSSLEEAYSTESVVVKRSETGVNLSTVSAPPIVLQMLDLLDVRPGQKVLEIGSGGYNAALLQELVGPSGTVTSIDIDSDVTERAEACLKAAGYEQVQVLCADAEDGAAGGPWDRIIVTVGVWDLPPTWSDQLADGGRIVVPLRLWGMTRAWALDKVAGRLESRAQARCGFVPVQGAGAHKGTSTQLGGGVGLWADEDQHVDAEALTAALAEPRCEAWSGVTVAAGQPYDDQDLWLAAHLPGLVLLTARPEAVESGIVDPSFRMGTPASVTGGTLAYRPRLRDTDDGRREFGAYAHGPDAAAAAAEYVETIQAWDRAGRPAPRMTLYPAGTPRGELPGGAVIAKRHTMIVLTWL